MTEKCAHYWCYTNSIYYGRNDDEIAVGRCCHKCGKQQIAFAAEWKPVPRSYVDMREEMKRENQLWSRR
jgi:hypothetical protein